MRRRGRPTISVGGVNDLSSESTVWILRRLWPMGLLVVALLGALLLRTLDSTPLEQDSRETPAQTSRPVNNEQATEIGSTPVVTPRPVGGEDFGDSVVQVWVLDGQEKCGWGSGTVVVDSLHVLTNLHVIEGSTSCRSRSIEIWRSESISSPPVKTYLAEPIGTDEAVDMALLRITHSFREASPLVPVEIGEEPFPGSNLTLVGFPAIGGASMTLSKGIVSGFADLDGVTWIKTDASISGGSSGGAALNEQGQLVGVPTMASQSEDGRVVDCRPRQDANRDGEIDSRDGCDPLGGFFNLVMPVSNEAVQRVLAIA